MKGSVLPAVAILVALNFIAACDLYGPTTIQCDGSVPIWMIEAQDYDDSGCAEVLPSGQAPPKADWTPYCLGMCSPIER
jgi:hypothetical protein